MKSLSSCARRALLFSILGVVPAALVAGGCGGGSDGSKSPDLKINASNVSGNLTFADISENSLVNAAPLVGISSIQAATLTNTRAGVATAQKLTLSAKAENAVQSTLTLSLGSSVTGAPLAPFRAGQRLEFPRAGSNIEFTQFSEATQSVNRWRVAGGAVVVRALSASSAELLFDAVRFEPVETRSSLGSFTLNGTLGARDLIVR